MPRAVCVNMVKRNVKWVREGVSPDSFLVMNSKLYSYSYHSDKVGNPSKKSDVVNVYRLKDGKPCSSLDATPIRNRVMQLKGEVTENAYPITDQAMTFASCKGKIYVAYLSGIYVYQEKAKNWKCVVDGVNNETFLPGKGMTIIDLLAYSDKAFYILAAKGNYDGEATDFLQYKLK